MATQTVEAGLFFLVMGFAFFFTFVTFRKGEFPIRAGLRLVAMSLFCIIAVLLGSGFAVVSSVDSTIHNTVTNETWTGTDQHDVISGDIGSSWLAWLFYGFAVLNLILIAKDFTVWKEKENNKI